MKVMGLKISVVVVIFVLTLSVLVFGQRLVYRYSTQGPLQAGFDRIDAIEDFEIVHKGREIYVQVMLKETDNLLDVYKQIYWLSNEHIGKDFAGIIIKDKRDEALKEIYYAIHFDIQEAIATGRFSHMAQEIEKKSSDLEVDKSAIYIENDKIFLQLHKGENYLYEVIHRDSSSKEEPSSMNGGRNIW